MKALGIAPRGARRSRSDALARSPRGELRGIQIGPRIRVGGTLGHIGQQIKLGVGKIASNPLVDAGLGLIPGVGPIAAGLIAAGGRALDTSKGSVGVGDILKSGAEGFGAAKLGSAVKTGIGGLTNAATANGGGVTGALKSVISGGGVDGQGSGGFVGDAVGKVGSLGKTALGMTPGAKGPSTLDRLLLAASVADQAAQRQRSMNLQNKALGYAEDQYKAAAPLRTAALDRLNGAVSGASGTPDFLAGSNNPYQRSSSGYLVGGAKALGPAQPVAQQRSGYLVGAA